MIHQSAYLQSKTSSRIQATDSGPIRNSRTSSRPARSIDKLILRRRRDICVGIPGPRIQDLLAETSDRHERVFPSWNQQSERQRARAEVYAAVQPEDSRWCTRSLSPSEVERGSQCGRST